MPRIALVAVLLCWVCVGTAHAAIDADKPLRPPFPGDDFTLREAMVPMRDGVRLYTLIFTPKSPGGPRPLLLQRTPYDASTAIGQRSTTRFAVMRGVRHPGDGYIQVFQDIRGRFGSEGEFLMYRAPRGEFNRTQTDESTDAWDTVDWLVKNVEGHNGRAGIWGTSYPGWLALAALAEPHPALAAAVPFNPVVDLWKSDDWFHWGAFRALYAFDFNYMMQTDPKGFSAYPYGMRDLYAWMLPRGSAAAGLGAVMDARHEMWNRIVANPSYGPYWKAVAADRWFERAPRRVPTLHVHGLFDQEDIYGAPAAYAALERHDAGNDANFLAIGPWYHGQHFAEGSTLGPLDFDEDTAKRFREDVLWPFLDHFLRDAATPPPAPVTAFETGSNRWRQLQRWPAAPATRALYLQPGGAAGFETPPRGTHFAEYVSDPAKPVPYTPRPTLGVNTDLADVALDWREWQARDQRFVDGRPDVASWQGEPVAAPLTLRGAPEVVLHAETTGTDADWVVKLIDVWPDEDPGDYTRSGMQIMISANIFRGRYRESPEQPRAIAANRVLEYRFKLPDVSHTLLPGHRLMVQVQSSWFPLYDRNPQSFVDSIMTAPPAAYRSARQRIHTSAQHPTHILLPADAGTP
jgi:hypothetical protein